MYSKYKQIFKNCDQDYLDMTFLKTKDSGKKEPPKKEEKKNEKKEIKEDKVTTDTKKEDVKTDKLNYNNVPLEDDPVEQKKYLYNDTDIQDLASYRYDVYNPQRGNYIQQDIERNGVGQKFKQYDPRKGNVASVSNTSNEDLSSIKKKQKSEKKEKKEGYEETNPSNHKCGISKDGKPLCGSNKDLDPILDPLFNLREVCKQMILLEDHLFQPKRRCEDCIKKHSLAIEGFLEEAITLDTKAEHHKLINDTVIPFKKIMKTVDNKMTEGNLDDATCVNAAQEIRLLRKELCLVSYSAC